MPARIVSLLPSATEALFAMGLGDQVVATSHECDHPPEATKLPAAMRTRVDASGSSGQIDEQVRALAEAGEPLYVVDEGVLHHVQPDLIVTQDTCQVCAAGPGHVHAALSRIEPVDRPEIVSLHAHTLDGVLGALERLGEAAGAPEAGRQLVDRVRRRVRAVREAADTMDERPRVLVLDWLDPPMVAGHWVPELVALAGGDPLLVAPGEPSSTVDWDVLVQADPEVLVLAPCGLSLERTREEAAALQERPGWQGLPAVQAGRVHVADAHRFFSRPGPSLADTLEMLATAVHPGSFRERFPEQAERIPPLG